MGKQQQLPPTTAIIEDHALHATTDKWFEYVVRVHPHHTDYGGIVWHGAYVTWMEEARVECLRSLGINFADLVGVGCDLPVVELSLRYHRSLRMGEVAVVKTRMMEMKGVRINWAYQIQNLDTNELCVSALVTLVAMDRDKGKIMRRLPPAMRDALVKFSKQ
jgi:acyl-CoA thioester hydrolase